ncbi:High choriolytic enzyme 2 [Halotydeus destructor]|nr:High choriolytic enzyme 2 [Halotydeus destructor]
MAATTNSVLFVIFVIYIHNAESGLSKLIKIKELEPVTDLVKSLTGELKFLDGIYEVPILSDLNDDDEAALERKSEMMATGIGGYSCRTKSCAGEGRSGTKWDYACNIGGVSEPFICVPFTLNKDLSEANRVEIFRAMKWMREKTCIAFVFRKNEGDYISISKGKGGCVSESIGKSGGKQFVNLGPGCFEYPTVVYHELMHAIGFEHLHQRNDRDRYMDIRMQNVEPALYSMFTKKLHAAGTDNMTWSYDSVMLYGSYDFQRSDIRGCKDPECYTIVTRDGSRTLSVYEKVGAADVDIEAINFLYGCEEFRATAAAE